jgi:hypothetical protein
MGCGHIRRRRTRSVLPPSGTRLAVGSTIAQRIRISRFGDANERCSAFEVRKRCRNSAQFMPRCTTIQSGAPSRHEASLQAETLCCLGRVALPRGIDRRSRDGGRAPCRRASVTSTPPIGVPTPLGEGMQMRNPLLSYLCIGPNQFHQNRIVSWLISIPRSARRFSTLQRQWVTARTPPFAIPPGLDRATNTRCPWAPLARCSGVRSQVYFFCGPAPKKEYGAFDSAGERRWLGLR